MKEERTISGFSKLSKSEKINWLTTNFFEHPEETSEAFASFLQEDENLQRIIDGFSENTVSNFVIPFGVAPNFVINGKQYCVPMVIEESSVVAAASAAAKYWLSRGGFKTEIIGIKKVGQVHFSWNGAINKLKKEFSRLKNVLRENASDLTRNMEKRGGGVIGIELLDLSELEPYYYQLRCTFNTNDSMGANFINSVLENFGQTLQNFIEEDVAFTEGERDVDIIMAILSNYTPECLVRASVSCPVDELGKPGFEENSRKLASKFAKAVRIAKIDSYRATTHNKGIFNGIDSIVLATGNDFRAVEACGHAYAARDGQYRSLSDCKVKNGVFTFWLDLPLAIGTVGGLTNLHPLAKLSLEMLGNPKAEELMQIIAAVGLAQNFAAIRSLVTTGIQKGHMKIHLTNILNHLGASEREIGEVESHFKDKVVQFSEVRSYLENIR